MAIILTLEESDDLPLECLNKTSNQTLVGGWATPLKNMSSSIRIMISNPIYGNIKKGNQTTNQNRSCLLFWLEAYLTEPQTQTILPKWRWCSKKSDKRSGFLLGALWQEQPACKHIPVLFISISAMTKTCNFTSYQFNIVMGFSCVGHNNSILVEGWPSPCMRIYVLWCNLCLDQDTYGWSSCGDAAVIAL